MLMHARMSMIRKLSSAAANIQTVFDPANASANAILTVGNTVVNTGDLQLGGARTISSNMTGKHQLALKVAGTATANIGAGFGLVSFVPADGQPTLVDTWTIQSGGGNYEFRINGANQSNLVVTPATNDIILLAYDADAGEIFFGLNGTYYETGVGTAVAAGSVPTTPTFTVTPGTLFYVDGLCNTGTDLTIQAPSPPPGWLSWN